MSSFIYKLSVAILINVSQLIGMNDIDNKQKKLITLVNKTTFRNGDSIKQAQSIEEWLEACKSGVPAWCHMNNDTSLSNRIGKIFNYHAIHDPRGILPVGYKIPTKEDASNYIFKDTVGMNLILERFIINLDGKPIKFGGIINSNGAFNFQKDAIVWWTSSEEDEDEIVFGEVYGIGFMSNFSDFRILELDKCSGMYVIGISE
jgi:hypothetical protein